ncbi:lysophospholipid acyltransferase family protein [Aestuariicoccus sp. MJ-SS9]|uniref:lysophospholipid acyltransferase family protein n=1 Tax=Aestuariicoccus sp. MJ-SS9 TaxID=3079855 RepID=UPI00290B5710|nr:lysophospholipid acyltransferase family protein [Aestuariicoccus sp. MJ-SS9]MDU8913129.1 lysophospholipid acyltransferase family protein [Aestuariicoccus sp. MJ-SS9]
MSPTWSDEDPPPPPRIGPGGWWRVAWRGGALGAVTFGGLGLLLLVRLVERPVFGMRRPVTPWITQGVCRMAFVILRLPLTVRGPRIKGPGAVVANHSSWLDIFALNARKNVYFVSKSEVAGWPGIGWLARATGTVFIRRDPREAAAQTETFRERLLQGHRLLFFPEGTSTDGMRVLPFKSTLFAAFFAENLRHDMSIQPVSVVYHAPGGADPRFYGWWGDMDFGPHLVTMLAARRQGRVELIYHPPVAVDEFPNRKSLARYLEGQVRDGHALAIKATED